MKTVTILSTHTSLAAAVLAAGIDLSYNEASAKRDIAELDRGHPHGPCPSLPVTEAFVVEEGGKNVVYYAYQCDLLLLNKYNPFHGCLHDGKFGLATVVGSELRFTSPIANRRLAENLQRAALATGTKFYAWK